VKRWLRANSELQLLGTYEGHEADVKCAIEKDNNTLLSGSLDGIIKVGIQPLVSVSALFSWIV